MALVLADRVRETTTTTGTGSVTLAGAYTGFQTFSAGVGTGNSTYYTIANVGSGEWEVGIGSYTSGGNTLSRTTVLSSSNSGSLVNFGAGSKDVFVTQPAERALYVASAGTGLESKVTAFTNGGIVYASSTSALATGSALVFDGTNLGVGVTPSASTLATIQSAYGITIGNNEAHTTKNAYYNAGWKYATTTTAARFSVGEGGSDFRFYTAPSGTAGAAITFTQAMTLDASGNLGIGATALSASYRLTTDGGRVAFTGNSDGLNLYMRYSSGTAGAFIGSPAANAFAIADSNGTQRMYLDSSGNLGLGVTPNTWYSGTKAVEIGATTALMDISGQTNLYQNAYLNAAGSLIYKTTNYATQYRMISGQHQWFYAASGSGTITAMTQAMTLDASGNLLVGNSTDPIGGNRLLVQSAATANNNRTMSVYNTAATSTTAFANRLMQLSSNASGADVSIHFTDQTAYNAYIGMGSGALYFATNGSTEKMRLDSSGNLGVGTTSPGALLDVGPTASSSIPAAILRGGAGLGNTGGLGLYTNESSANARNWGIVSNSTVYGDFSIRQGNSVGVNPLSGGTDRFYISLAGDVLVGDTTTIGTGGKFQVKSSTDTSIFKCTSALAYAAIVSNVENTAARLMAFQYGSGGSPTNVGRITTDGTNIAIVNVSGITFPATQAASADANTLDDYEEGTWTLTDGSGAGLSITTTNAKYTKIGRLVYVSTGTITYPVTASTANAVLSGLPFVNSAANAATVGLVTTTVGANRALVVANASYVFFYANSSDTVSTNASLSGANIYGFAAVYQV